MEKRVSGTAEYLLFGAVVILTLPGGAYLLENSLIATGRLDIPTLRRVAADSFGWGLVAPFTSIAALPLLLVLWVGGRRLSLKLIAMMFLAAAAIGLVLFPVSKSLG